jgi:hypothetical protein
MSQETNIFERASRLRLLFSTAVGNLSVSDLWDLPLTSTRNPSLDDVARAYHRALKDAQEESFVVKATKSNSELQLAFDIVKYIIDVKIAERDEAKAASERKEKKARLQELIADKQDESLKGKSLEELTAMVEAL